MTSLKRDCGWHVWWQALVEIEGPAVVGPMTTEKGLGISYKHAITQNLEKNFKVSQRCRAPWLLAPKNGIGVQSLGLLLCADALLFPCLLHAPCAAPSTCLCQVPKELIDGLPGTVSVLQDFVSERSPEKYLRTKWLLGRSPSPSPSLFCHARLLFPTQWGAVAAMTSLPKLLSLHGRSRL